MNTALISVTGSVGCLTVVIILGAILGGMWLDGHYGTKPTWTLTLALLSIPVSLVAMLVAVRAIIKRIQPELVNDQKKQSSEEDRSSGS
jgi:hypothetical protein